MAPTPRGRKCDCQCHSYQSLRRLVVMIVSFIFSGMVMSACKAQSPELKFQKPWVYTYQVNKLNNIDFVATAPAAEDAAVMLLLACSGNERIYVSFIDSDKFPYPLKERSQLTWRLDNSEPISLPVAIIDQKQITADPRPGKDLMPILMRSNMLSASITDIEGIVHIYTFSLQPNDLALRDIDVHCLRSGS